MYSTFRDNLAMMKRIPEPTEGEKPTVVDLTRLVPGLRDIKLYHHFKGEEVTALKVRVEVTKKGIAYLPSFRQIDGEDVPFSKNNFNASFAEPGGKELNAFDVAGYEGQQHLHELLADFGIKIDPKADAEKLHKRLKRALLVATYAGTTEFDIKINPDTALPKDAIDGAFLIKLSTAKRMLKAAKRKEKVQAYDTIQASLAWSEGLVKGTAILMPDLETDVIVQECNIKREATFDKPLLCIEGFHHARTPCSDLQTMGNLLAVGPLERVARYHLAKLAEIADNPKAADRWFAEEFKHHDWYRNVVQDLIKDGKKIPPKPPLSICRDAGMKQIAHTPVLKEVVYKHACRTLDIRDLKARFPKGEAVAGYMIPDLSIIGNDGCLVESEFALKPGEIRGPRHHGHQVPEGPVVTTRNPNAWGEAAIRMVVDHKQWRSRTAVQISIADCTGGTLAIWGGADMDDSLCLWASPDMLEAHCKSEDERQTNEIDRVDLEQYIDSSQQDASGFDLSLASQMELAVRPLPMHLGQIVNFFMNLRLCRRYEWYKKAAACKKTTDPVTGVTVPAVVHLKRVYDEYNRSQPWWADIFCPEAAKIEKYGWDKDARVPRSDGEYIAHIPCRTDVGMVVMKLANHIHDMLYVERTTNLLHKGARICTPEGMRFLFDCVKDDAARVRAEVLNWGWRCLTSETPIDPLTPGRMQQFIHGKFDTEMYKLRDWEDFAKKKAEWGRLCSRVLTGKMENDEQIVASLAITVLGYTRRWDKETGAPRNKFGVDSLMWNPTLGDEDVVLESGLPAVWASLIAKFENTLM